MTTCAIQSFFFTLLCLMDSFQAGMWNVDYPQNMCSKSIQSAVQVQKKEKRLLIYFKMWVKKSLELKDVPFSCRLITF